MKSTEELYYSKVDLLRNFHFFKMIKNELIECIEEEIQDFIGKRINEAPFFACIVDETTDITEISQYSIAVRLVDTEGDIQEFFLGFHDVSESRNAEGLCNVLCNALHKYDVQSAAERTGTASLINSADMGKFTGNAICDVKRTDRLDTATCTHTLLSTGVHIRTDHVRYTLRYLHCFSVVSCPHPSDSALNGILTIFACNFRLGHFRTRVPYLKLIHVPFAIIPEKNADIVYVYGLCDGSSLRPVAEYERRFPNRRVPYRRVLNGVG
ncbi:hypothetical protein ANN_17879 [Periplaneta americana]|uniref:DUF4371 domain-containing protein n=1 Tax=Periplaneta americana TaxID=6978 RepID=A0ABQ8SV46_PERAM|nr:hypothetical protein ANN_17879 [Periplaneta americana]